MRTLLQKKIPIPKHYTYGFKDSFVSAILVFVCLIAFKPSFISEIRFLDQAIISAIISLVTLSVLLLKCVIVGKMERSGKWTLKKDLISLFIIFLTISLVLSALSPFVLNYWLKLSLNIDGRFLLILAGFVHLIGLLLYFVSISARYLINGQNDKSANAQNINIEEAFVEQKPATIEIVIEGKNQGERVAIPKENLVCVSTNGHYIDIFLLERESHNLKKLVFRNSILSIATSLDEHDEFIQCHRSHLVNLNHIENLLGSSKKMEAQFKNLEFKVPVSRAKAPLMIEMMEIRNE